MFTVDFLIEDKRVAPVLRELAKWKVFELHAHPVDAEGEVGTKAPTKRKNSGGRLNGKRPKKGELADAVIQLVAPKKGDEFPSATVRDTMRAMTGSKHPDANRVLNFLLGKKLIKRIGAGNWRRVQ